MINVLVWNEFEHERIDDAVKKIYPNGIHSVIAEFLQSDDISVKTATLQDENCGITKEILDNTDVLLWWGHMRHGDVPDETAKLVRDAVLEGMGIIFLRGSTTGGTDILGRVLLRRFQHIPLGKILLAMDFVIVTTAGFFYGTLEASLYAIISIYVVEKATDSVLYGFNESRIAYIVSDKPTEIAQRIMDETGRGVTYLNGEGGYQRAKKLVVMCALPSRQFAQLKRIALEVDPLAFIMVSTASNVIGEGFSQTFDEV